MTGNAATTWEEYEAEKSRALELVEREIKPRSQWYARRLKTPRILYIVSTYLTVIFSAFVTFLAALSPESALFGVLDTRDLLIILSLSITILTGINASFQYQQTWHGRMAAFLRIQFLLQEYRVDIEANRIGHTVDQAINRLWAQTDTLFEQVKQIVLQETDTFFSSLRVERPSGKKPGTGSSDP